MKNESGITLIALVVTIIVLLILAGVSIGANLNSGGSIDKSKSNVALAELSQIQEVILEAYTKYLQTGNDGYLVGTKQDYTNIDNKVQEINTNISSNIKLQLTSDEANEDGKAYYEISKDDLEDLGIKDAEDTYIVNYSTGEVFNITKQKTEEGDVLYISK